MSEIMRSAWPGAEFTGFVQVSEAGLQGMITLRGDLAAPKLATALKAATGCAMPVTRKITRDGAHSLVWMSPDELLILCPHGDAPALTDRLSREMAGEFVTLANVSDARAMFRVTGAMWRDALAKLCPVDFSTLDTGDIRRTRAAQIAAAILVTDAQEAQIICFRSVAGYMFDLLSIAAAPGAEPALYV